jgi:hypothetical protein
MAGGIAEGLFFARATRRLRWRDSDLSISMAVLRSSGKWIRKSGRFLCIRKARIDL